MLDLDDETRSQLGFATARADRDDHLDATEGLRPSRIAPGDIDGRSKRNWRHKREAPPVVAQPSETTS